MKLIRKQAQSILLSAAAAAYLRMFFPALSWVSWPDLAHEPVLRQIGRGIIALLLLPLLEIIRFWYGYLLASLAVALVANKVLPYNRNLLSYLLLGVLPSLIWFAGTPTHWPSQKVPILIIYGLTGLLYGFLYHWHFVKNQDAVPLPRAKS
jgi:hypothetical protein